MVSGGVDELWTDTSSGGRILSPKSNLLAAWRLDPCLLLTQNCSPKDSLADTWIAQASQRDTESLTLALQRELCSRDEEKLVNLACNAAQSKGATWSWQGSDTTASSVKTECGSDAGSPMTSSETEHAGSPVPNNVHGKVLKLQPCQGAGHEIHNAALNAPMPPALVASKQYVNPLSAQGATGANAGKVSKRRSRAANKPPITFLATDPANFRAMVQQVTGIPFNPSAAQARLCGPGGGGVAMPLLRPQPKRPPTSSHTADNIQGLPTLDTSAFLIDSAMFMGRPPLPQQFRTDVSGTNLVHLSCLVHPQPLPSPNHSLAPPSQLPPPCFPGGLRLDSLANSSSNLSGDAESSLRGQFLTQKLKAACVKANQSMLHSLDQSPPDFKPPTSSTSLDNFFPMENSYPDHHPNIIPNAIHGSNIRLDSCLSSDGLINSG